MQGWGRASVAIALVVGCQSAAVVAPPLTPAPKLGTHEASAPPSAPTVAASDSASASGSDSDSESAEPASPSGSASESTDVALATPPKPVCTPQQPLSFLVRANYIPVKTKKKEFEKALEWRSKQYGFVKGWSKKTWGTTKATSHAVSITLFGLPVRVNERIVPALRCAEAEIAKSCAATPYTPASLSGFREKNTYHGGEVTNHLWGIALDIDPTLNPCCGCTKKWKASPLCKKKVTEEFERMAMPECWVDAFEKYGFYWLGHDVLKDTMHFEFLADPDKVMTMPATAASVSTTPLSANADLDDD